MPIVFLHGITVRRDRFGRLVENVTNRFRDVGVRTPVTGCYWGDLGRSAEYTGMTIPGFSDGTRAVDEAAPSQDDAPLLMALLEDPLAELVSVRDDQEFGLDALGFLPVPAEVAQRNAALSAIATPAAEHLAGAARDFAGPDVPLAENVKSIVDAAIIEAARANRTLTAMQLIDPLARSLTASMYRGSVAKDDLGYDFRWNQAYAEAVFVLEEQLGGQRAPFKNLASGALTFALRRGLRQRMMPGLSLFLGDVMAWFANRSTILDRVGDAVAEAREDGPLVMVGHSLGGVIAFEWCMQADRDVTLLATVGSQVGFFAELGVLTAPAPAASGKRPLPPRVGSWRNIYDPDDALAFLAEPVFKDVGDIELDTGAPFPAAHSEYWNLASTYAKVKAAAVML